VYPALSVLQTLSRHNTKVLWVGGQGGMEKDLIERERVPFTGIPAAGLHGVGISRLPANLLKLAQGWIASQRILREFKPDVLFFTGGYLAAPMALAGRKLPSLVFVPDIEPGLSLKFLFRFSKKIALNVDETLAYIPRGHAVEVTGYPVRASITQWDKQSARHALNLKEDKPVLTILGGSKGARSINRAVIACLSGLLEQAQVLHITGKLDWDEVSEARNQLSPFESENYHAFPYLHEEIGAALAAADLIVSRAGASTLGEYPLFGTPSILIPYPYAWRYQMVNASYLVKKGAAVMVRDENLGGDLLRVVKELLSDRTRLDQMSSAMKSLARPGAAQRLATLLLEMGTHTPKGVPAW